MIEDWNGLNVTVMGLGLFGGGLGVSRWLLQQGARVTITDLKTEEQLAASVKELEGEPVRWRLGQHEWDDFRNADVVVVNPAVPRSSPYVQAAVEAGLTTTSEMNLFLERCPARILAVTGSNGKTTTATLTWEMMRRGEHRAWLGGNVGVSLLNSLDLMKQDDWAVLELSSFQLENLEQVQLGPDIAAVTNLSPNHLDRHGTMAAYGNAKKNILRYLRPGGRAVLNRSDPEIWSWAGDCSESAGRPLAFCFDPEEPWEGVYSKNGLFRARQGGRDVPLLQRSEFALPGPHNSANAQAAAAAALAAGAPHEAVCEALRCFRGIPHRMEYVGEAGGVQYYNDSKATTPLAAIMALRSFSERVILLAGGYDKKLPLDEFVQEIRRRAKRVYLLGNSAEALHRSILSASQPGEAPDLIFASNLEEAVTGAARTARRNDVVLLSPGFASYGLYNNYVERGDQFRHLAREQIEGSRQGPGS